MSKGTWGDVQAWAKAEIEKARTGLETVTDPIDICRLQTRIAVMRELQAIQDVPAVADIPAPVSY